jgi:hypothetical protein
MHLHISFGAPRASHTTCYRRSSLPESPGWNADSREADTAALWRLHKVGQTKSSSQQEKAAPAAAEELKLRGTYETRTNLG